MDLTSVLEATVLSADVQQAEKLLEQAAQQDLLAFLKLLAEELANVSKSAVARAAAGLQLKNHLTSKDPDVKLQFQNRWITFPAPDRQAIKTLTLQALGTETTKPTAPQCIAYIASAELPMGQWPELIQTLLANVTNAQSLESLKIASLDAIGYICEELNTVVLAPQSNEILTAIVQGMRKEEPSVLVRLAACKAMYNSLEFTKANFDKETERHFIMQVLCEATQCPHEQVIVASLQNLVKVMSLYYRYMESYMGPALFAITLEAMKSPVDDIALQAIEFWSTVCDEEQDLAIEAAEAMELGRAPEQISFHYAKGALQFIAPILLLTLTKQEEYDNEDDWNPCKAAGVCLTLMANTTEDAIIPHVVLFVKEHISNTDWKFRDAAVMALGCIMEGPQPDSLIPHVAEVVNVLIGHMANDESVQVKDSAAWTIGRVCEQVPTVVLQAEVLPSLLEALVQGLNREPRVAANVCWALSSLVESAYETALSQSTTDDVETYQLSIHFEALVAKLIATASRTDSSQSNLRTSGYEALMDFIKYSAQDCYSVVQRTMLSMLEMLQSYVQMEANVQGSDRQHLADVESLVCATLQSLLRKLVPSDIILVSDTLVQLLVAMLSTATGQTGGVQEDAILTLSTLVESLGEGFMKYMTLIHPYLKAALRNYNDIQVCLAAVGLVGDICRGIGSSIEQYVAEIMEIMVETLSNPNVHRSIKPPILSTLGDIALAIGDKFARYAHSILKILEQASSTSFTKAGADYELQEYINELRDGVLEGCTGILQGLRGDKDDLDPNLKAHMELHVQWILVLIETIGNDEDKTENNIAGSAGLLGDLLSVFGQQLIPHINQRPSINKLLMEGRQSRQKRTKTLATWATRTIKSLQQGDGLAGGSKGK